jgi:leucyl aminopeptidase
MPDIQFKVSDTQLGESNIANQPVADALVILTDKTEAIPSLQPQLDTALTQAFDTTEKEDPLVLSTLGLVPYQYIAVAQCSEPKLDSDELRMMGVKIAKLALKHKWNAIRIQLTEGLADKASIIVYAITEGVLLGQYQRKTYKQAEKRITELSSIEYLMPDGAGNIQNLERSIETAKIYAEAVCFARDLTNIPGNMLTPQKLAEEAIQLAETTGLEYEVLDEKQLLEKGMHALYSVGKGSQNQPRMIVLKYQGRDTWDDVLGLVGKGITFDTGGISLKRAADMDEMISDMGGAAVVLGAMKAAAALKPKVNLLAVIPCAENMPSSSAYKPGDVIGSLSGKTIEVLNTDAEGRIVLADGITYAKQLGAAKLIDIATLTGAVMVALGDTATGAITNDKDFYNEFLAAAKHTGERIWQLPVYPEYKEKLKSSVADLKNHGGRYAGMITGGLFIGAFADETPWIHLDIGGTAFLEREQGVNPKGGTGVIVRTLAECFSGRLSEI